MSARILVIEDNPANMELMTYLLSAFGYQVDNANDGEEGMDCALQSPPNLIICDLELPGINGFVVVKHLRGQIQTKRVPMVAVTAYAMVGDRDRILASGFDGYISKPIDPETFVQEVETFLPTGTRASRIPETQQSTPQTDPVQQTDNALVLVVNDSPMALRLIRTTLELKGYRVITAETADVALKLTRHYAFDLILSDLPVSPDGGLEFLRLVKANTDLRSIPFMLCNSSTTEPTEAAFERAAELGAERIVPRPVSPEQMLEEVAACLMTGRNKAIHKSQRSGEA